MISRVADHCFWLGRYLERAESTARVLSVTRNLALDADRPASQCWQPIVIVSGEEAEFTRRFGTEAAEEGELVEGYMTWDTENLTSIQCSVRAARENARSIREVVSLEVWESVNEMHLWMGSPQARAQYESNRYGFYRQMRHAAQLCMGLLAATMLHESPLDFAWLGITLERVGQTARILDVHHHTLTRYADPNQIVDTALWLALLRACSGFEPFVKRHPGGAVTASAVAAFLVLEPKFPRSVRFAVHSAYKRLAEIRPPADYYLPGGQSLERLHVLDVWLQRKSLESLDPAIVHDLLTHVVDETAAICNDLGREMFGYAPPQSQSQSQSQMNVAPEPQ
jgi:uncharacterized alpha-E superfamily protein